MVERLFEAQSVVSSILTSATIEIIIWIRNSKSVSNSVSIRLELGFV